MIWLRATLPRLRIDQIMGFAWKFLFPLSLINIFVTAIEVLVWEEPTTVQLWAIGGINLLVLVIGIVVFSYVLRRQQAGAYARVAVPPVAVGGKIGCTG